MRNFEIIQNNHKNLVNKIIHSSINKIQSSLHFSRILAWVSINFHHIYNKNLSYHHTLNNQFLLQNLFQKNKCQAHKVYIKTLLTSNHLDRIFKNEYSFIISIGLYNKFYMKIVFEEENQVFWRISNKCYHPMYLFQKIIYFKMYFPLKTHQKCFLLFFCYYYC